MMDFVYRDVSAPTKASKRFLTLERMVSDLMTSCSSRFSENSYRYKFTWQPSIDKVSVLYLWESVKNQKS